MKSERAAVWNLPVTQPVATSVVLITLGLVSQPVLPSVAAGRHHSSRCQPSAPTGSISGIVVDERQEPVARVQVHAFSVRTAIPQAQLGQTVPFSMQAGGSASTDAEGRFWISALEPGDFLVAADPVPTLPTGGSSQAAMHATTFYPSTVDYRVAMRVSAMSGGGDTLIRIELVRVNGVRVAGSVVSPSDRQASGMDVRLFHRFGGFGSESTAAVVNADGTFELPRVPPGWYRVTIAPRQGASNAGRGDFATTLIEVRDQDIDGLVLTLGPGASITGRIVAEPGTGIQSAVGLRVTASLTGDQYAASKTIAAAVAPDWTFRMTGLSGAFQFAASADRPPFVKATRLTVDGVETVATTGVEFTEGSHALVVFVAPHEVPAPAVDKALSTAALVEQFKGEKVFWRQFTIAREIVNRKALEVLPSLAAWLNHEDRHVRGNAAFIFGGLGDARGLEIISEILTDRSNRPEGQGIATASSDGRYHVERQIATDRYYAAHLLGDLRDARAVPILAPLLKDEAANAIVPWALGQIDDKGAVGPLVETLDDDNPSMLVLAIYALETLNAKEALPRLISLRDDHRRSNFGAQVSVAEAAKAAIATLHGR